MTEQAEEICAMCKHIKMKEYPQHAKVGLGRCGGYDGTLAPLTNPFVPWSKPACVRFVPGGNRTARRQWIAKQQGKDQNDNDVPPETKG